MARARRAAAGGIRGLLDLIDEVGEALDADLQHHYGLSLNDVASGELTLRRLKGLVAHLPSDGTAMWRHARRNPKPGVVADPPADWWTPERDLLASVVDSISRLTWALRGKEGSAPPKPIKRPGVEQGRVMGKTSLPPEQVLAALARIGPQPLPSDECEPPDPSSSPSSSV